MYPIGLGFEPHFWHSFLSLFIYKLVLLRGLKCYKLDFLRLKVPTTNIGLVSTETKLCHFVITSTGAETVLGYLKPILK